MISTSISWSNFNFEKFLTSNVSNFWFWLSNLIWIAHKGILYSIILFFIFIDNIFLDLLGLFLRFLFHFFSDDNHLVFEFIRFETPFPICDLIEKDTFALICLNYILNEDDFCFFDFRITNLRYFDEPTWICDDFSWNFSLFIDYRNVLRNLLIIWVNEKYQVFFVENVFAHEIRSCDL